MNNKHRKILKALFDSSPPTGLPWADLESLFVALGATITEGNGSRAKFDLGGETIAFHRPHKPKTTRAYQDAGTRIFGKYRSTAMKNAMNYKGYVGTVEYSEEDGCLFGRIAGIQDIISYEGESVAEIRQAFEEAVDDYLEHCASTNKEPNKPYSGKFILRIDPSLHARLAAKAQASGKSLNHYAAEALSHA